MSKNTQTAVSKPNGVKQAKGTSLNPYAAIIDGLGLLGCTIRRNDVTREVELNGEAATEQRLNSLYIELTGEGCKAKVYEWQLFINSDHIQCYNPIDDYFHECDKQDPPKGYIDALTDSLHLDPAQGMPKAVARLFIRKWLIGVVAGIYGDYYNALFVILCGPKGCGKTEFWRRLLPDKLRGYYAESKLDAGKDDEALAAKSLVMMIDEVDHMTRRKDAAELRRFISANKFSFRAPYARSTQTVKRLASLCGTSNEMQVVTDPENNRRLVPIAITAIDHAAYNAIDKDKLFAEAYHLFKDGEDWHLTSNDIALLDQYTAINAVVETEVELVAKWFVADPDGFMTATDVAVILQAGTSLRLRSNMIGRALRAAGFSNFSKRVKGKDPAHGWQIRPKA
ncbi:MAG: hypothetical protein J7539_12750 [Niabella sp.]|nr:hypothetical protein [Niabella sp.]